MISLARRSIAHAWGKFLFTGVGLGLLVGVTLSMAGVYRGMVDDAKVLLDGSGADLWVVQQGTLGPYAEPSSIADDAYRSVLGMAGVARAANVTYLTMQVGRGAGDVRAMVVGVVPGGPGEPGQPRSLVAGRHLTRARYEAVADVATGFRLGDRVRLRHDEYTVVGLTRRTVSSSGDPMIFVPLKDAQEAQFVKDPDAVVRRRRRTAATPGLNPPGSPRVLDAVLASQSSSPFVNAVLVQVAPGEAPDEVARRIARWTRLQVYTRAQVEEVLVGKLIATSARQIAMFLVILALVSAAVVAFIIYTLTAGKIREIAVLKLIGARDRTIARMIVTESLALGVIGFVVGKIAATGWAPIFPKHVLLVPGDALRGLVAVLAICVVASVVAVRAALAVDPADAIGG